MNNKKKQTSTNKKANTNRNRRRRLVKRARRRQRKIDETSAVPFVKMSACAIDYCRAVVNPFSSFKTLPCIPDLTIIPTNKICCRVRGIMSAGTGGVGFVAVNPFSAVFNNVGIVGNLMDVPVVYTGTNYAGTTFTVTPTAGVLPTGVFGANSNSPYTLPSPADVPQWSWRVVACGVSIRYIGAELNRTGRVMLFKDPSNTNIPDGTDANELYKTNYTESVPTSRKREYVYYTPVTTDDTSFKGFTTNLPIESGANRMILLLFVDGVDVSVKQSWEFEAVFYYEISAPTLSLTTSHSDPVGLGAILTSLPNKAPTASGETVFQQVFRMATQQIAKSSSQVLSGISGAAYNAAAAYVKNSLNVPSLPMIEDAY